MTFLAIGPKCWTLSQFLRQPLIVHLTPPPAYSKESNYLYVIPLKEFYTEKITVGVRSSLNLYHIPYTKGCHLFCTAPLDGQFLRLAVAVKTKIIMMAYKYPATLTVNGSPLTPLRSPNPMDSFIKHRVSWNWNMLWHVTETWNVFLSSLFVHLLCGTTLSPSPNHTHSRNWRWWMFQCTWLYLTSDRASCVWVTASRQLWTLLTRLWAEFRGYPTWTLPRWEGGLCSNCYLKA